jgi:uncharacterized membrane protein YqjE
MNHDVHNGRDLTALLSEMKDELKDVIQTRVAMFKMELQEKIAILKSAAPLAVAGILLLGTAYLLLTLALVGLVLAAFPDNPYRWAIAFAAVGVLWLIMGSAAAYFAYREFQLKGLMPKRTVEMLKEDKQWIQQEVKNQI